VSDKEKAEKGSRPGRRKVIAVASGKGGTGKTTVAVNLARAAGTQVDLYDCDVEEPNAHLFLSGEKLDARTVTVPVPEVDSALCDGCGECGKFCAYNAIVSFGAEAVVFEDMCHGCGGCARVCPKGAITEKEMRIGTVETIRSGNVTLVQGRLDVGKAMAPPLIRQLTRRIGPSDNAIIDAPPGTSCPVVTAVRGAGYAVLVTEPTPFGLNDLVLAVEMTRETGVAFGVVVNRAGIGDGRVNDFCAREGITILAEIPDDRRIAEAYSRGELAVEALPEYRGIFEDLLLKAREGAI
jgi:MinD superfamily P-loop ATPase